MTEEMVKMKLHLKRLSIWPTLKVTFMVSLVFGFAFGLLYAIFFAFIMAVGTAFEPYGAEEFGMASAGVLIVFMPIFFAFFSAIFNSIAALICAIVYNFVARTMGGLEYEVEVLEGGWPRGHRIAPTQPPPAPPSQPFPPTPLSPQGDEIESGPSGRSDERPPDYNI